MLRVTFLDGISKDYDADTVLPTDSTGAVLWLVRMPANAETVTFRHIVAFVVKSNVRDIMPIIAPAPLVTAAQWDGPAAL